MPYRKVLLLPAGPPEYRVQPVLEGQLVLLLV